MPLLSIRSPAFLGRYASALIHGPAAALISQFITRRNRAGAVGDVAGDHLLRLCIQLRCARWRGDIGAIHSAIGVCDHTALQRAPPLPIGGIARPVGRAQAGRIGGVGCGDGPSSAGSSLAGQLDGRGVPGASATAISTRAAVFQCGEADAVGHAGTASLAACGSTQAVPASTGVAGSTVCEGAAPSAYSYIALTDQPTAQAIRFNESPIPNNQSQPLRASAPAPRCLPSAARGGSRNGRPACRWRTTARAPRSGA